uniref:Cir_N domain-containing protein n=1 Tax=Panagrellus redivivus TaxID=6233 RepID=A0A7E4VX98_PANRE
MSKKDFHPSAWWNLKKVWEAKEKKKLDEQKQEELKIQYEKEQEIMNNKALLGDEKAKLGLSFMYDAPTGMAKREEPKEEPKFEWQRKYNAPREEWAKGNDAIQDQPFGIQVRNVRCVKCHTWGHLNTDRECPMFNMSGNADNPGYANNPSDLLRELEKEKEEEKKSSKQQKDDSDDDEESAPEEEVKVERIDQIQLLADMKEDHGFNFKKNILQNIRSDDVLTKIKTKAKVNDDVQALLKGLDSKTRLKVLKKTFGVDSKEYKAELAAVEEAKAAKKAAKAEKKAAKKLAKKEKKSSSSKKVKREVVSESSSDSASSDSESESVERHRSKHHSKHREDSDDDRRRPQKSHGRHESRDRKRRHDSASDDSEDEVRRKKRYSDDKKDRRDRKVDRYDDYDRRDRRSRRSYSRERR